jgi:hypothetical protein
MARVNPRMLIDGGGDSYNTPATPTPAPSANPLSALQTSIVVSKEQVQSKNVEIATIALEQAVNTGDVAGVQKAATALGKAQGMTGSELRTFAYDTAQTAAKGEKPEDPPADEQYTYQYVWKQDVGSPGGKWVLTKSPNAGPATWFTDSNGMLFYKGKPFTGTKDGIQYVNGKGPGYKEVGSGNLSKPDLDPATAELIKSLQDQISALSVGNQQAAANKAAADALAVKQKRESALVALTDRFARYGLASLVPKIRELINTGASEDTIALQLQDTEEYKQRFIANQDRLKKGLAVLDPGTYIGLEDRYRQILRAYGLKQFDNDSYVTQFLANDVSPEELSSRVVNAVQRVQNADPAVSQMLRQYYNIGTTDMVAYVLDPNNQLPKIERQIGAAEIGVAAGRQGLTAGVTVAEQLAAQGVTQAEAQRGYATIADILPQATKLSEIYTGVLDQYSQAEAEQEVFNSLASAQRKRRALTEREIASFSGSSGLGRTSLSSQVGGNI